MAIKIITIDLEVLGDITSNAFITNGGTASQFVKGDGTLDSSVYLTSAITSITPGTGLDITAGNTPTLTLDFTEFSIGGTLTATDYLVAVNGGVENRQLISSIPLGIFNNDQAWTSNLGIVESLTTTGTTGAATLVSGVLNIPNYTPTVYDNWNAYDSDGTGVVISNGFILRYAAGTFINSNVTDAVGPDFSIAHDLSATGSPSATTFLRGDNTWATPAGTTYTADEGITLTGSNFAWNLLNLTAGTTPVGGDTWGYYDLSLGRHVKQTLATTPLSAFSNDLNWNNYSLPQATATTRGGVELFSNTVQTVAGNTVSAIASRTYGVQLNAANQMVVNVPWTDSSGYTGWTIKSGLDGATSAFVQDTHSVHFKNGTFVGTNLSDTTGPDYVIDFDLTASGTPSSSTFLRGDNTWATPTDTVYVHPDHTGQVTSTGDGATVVTVSAITAQTALTTGLAGTDELLISDNGVIKRMDVSVMNAYFNANLSFGSGDGVVESLTTTGTSGAATLVAGVLNIPNYATGSSPNNATITLAAGTGLTTGGAFTTDQATNETITFNIGAGAGIDVNADDVAIDYSTSGNNLIEAAFTANGALASTYPASADSILVADNSAGALVHEVTFSNLRLSAFSNDLGWTSNTGDITGVNITAGTGLTGTVNTTSGQHTQTLAISLGTLSTDSTLSGASYNGTASPASWGINLSNVNQWEAQQVFRAATETTSGTTDTVAWNLNTEQVKVITLDNTTTCTISNPTNPQQGGMYTLILKQGTTANTDIAWGNNYKWPGGVAPNVTQAANSIDVISFVYDGSNMLGTVAQNFS